LDWAFETLSLKSFDDWYYVSRKQVMDIGGVTLLSNYFGGSLQTCLMTVYSDYDWKPWRFTQGAPMGYWDAVENQKQFFQWAASELDITTDLAWSTITKKRLISMGGAGFGSTVLDVLRVIVFCTSYRLISHPLPIQQFSDESPKNLVSKYSAVQDSYWEVSL
jgi:hypothetical protein